MSREFKPSQPHQAPSSRQPVHRSAPAAGGTQSQAAHHSVPPARGAQSSEAAYRFTPAAGGAHRPARTGGIHRSASAAGTHMRAPEREAPQHAVSAGRTAGAHASGAAQAPINAVDAAHRAARSDAGQAERFRREAAGHAVAAKASPGAGRSGRALVVVSVLVGIALAVALLVVVGSAVVGALLQDEQPRTEVAANDSAASTTPEDVFVLAADGGTIELDGSAYSLVSSGDGYSFASQRVGSTDEPMALFEVTGEPVGFAIHRGTFYVVSNADSSCYVQSFVPSDGSIPADYYSGTGTISTIDIKNAQLILTDDAGEQHAIDLPQG